MTFLFLMLAADGQAVKLAMLGFLFSFLPCCIFCFCAFFYMYTLQGVSTYALDFLHVSEACPFHFGARSSYAH